MHLTGLPSTTSSSSKEVPCLSGPGRTGLRAVGLRGAPSGHAVRRAGGADGNGVADCRFLAGCQTYNDPLVPAWTKGPAGRGCVAQTDAYRRRHCKTFACQHLCRAFVLALRGRSRNADLSCPSPAGKSRT